MIKIAEGILHIAVRAIWGQGAGRWLSLVHGVAATIFIGLVATAPVGADDVGYQETVLRFCGDGAGWPPYTYYKRENGKKTNEVIGYDVDVLHEIFDPLDMKIEVSMLPWSRCLVLAEEGEEYQAALSASYSKERARTFLLTTPYYALNGHFYYSTKVMKQLPAIKTFEDLAALGSVCGLHGYSYESYDVSFEDLDTGAKDYAMVIRKTMTGRCHSFIARSEIVAGFGVLGEDLLAGTTIAHVPLPWAKPDDFHMLISRNYAHKYELIDILDAGIKRLKASGRLDELLKNYIN